MEHKVSLKAKPEAIDIDLQRTAPIVVDMQSAFCNKGGMIDLLGRDYKILRQAIEPCKRVINTMRGIYVKGCILL